VDSFFFFFSVLGLEFMVFTLSHSTSTYFVMGFFGDRVSGTICQGLASNCDPPDLCFLSS
jgi:hypothetical protein